MPTAPITIDPPPVETWQSDSSVLTDLQQAPADKQSLAPVTEVPSPLESRRTLLVVDDQASVCVSIAYFLELCGYRVLRAESGQAAVDLFAKEQIDGVLLDIQMPRLNGFQTSARLREIAQAANRQLKVWFMTAVSYRELNDDCARAGGVAVFRKPFEWPNLLAELARGLGTAPNLPKPHDASASEQS